MSGIAIVGELLTLAPPLSTIVAGDRLKAGMLPQGVALPNILLTRVGRTEWQPLAKSPLRLVTERIQATVRAGAYDEVEPLLGHIRTACADRTGTIAGYTNVSVLLAGSGPDFMDEAATIFMGSTDLRVSFNEPA